MCNLYIGLTAALIKSIIRSLRLALSSKASKQANARKVGYLGVSSGYATFSHILPYSIRFSALAYPLLYSCAQVCHCAIYERGLLEELQFVSDFRSRRALGSFDCQCSTNGKSPAAE